MYPVGCCLRWSAVQLHKARPPNNASWNVKTRPEWLSYGFTVSSVIHLLLAERSIWHRQNPTPNPVFILCFSTIRPKPFRSSSTRFFSLWVCLAYTFLLSCLGGLLLFKLSARWLHLLYVNVCIIYFNTLVTCSRCLMYRSQVWFSISRGVCMPYGCEVLAPSHF